VTQDLANIVQAELERSGRFRGVDAAGAVLDDNTRPDLAVWRKQGANALLTGSVRRLGDDRFEVRFRLWDSGRSKDLGGQSHAAPAAELRRVAHRTADAAYEKLTGDKGTFATRIAYVTKNVDGIFNLWVADSDAEGAQSALRSSQPIISPSWAPNGKQLAYVSFERKNPNIYVHDVETGKRQLLVNLTGLNSYLDPTWSPDGKTMALAVGLDGGPTQIYMLDTSQFSEAPRRITNSLSNDKSPNFSPDGKFLYFVSDREGNDQIYRMEASSGRNVQRITSGAFSNISPAISPGGDMLAFVSQVKGGFAIHVMNLLSGTVMRVTDTIADSKPRFSPDGHMIIYSTKNGTRGVLVTSTLDGKVKTRLGSVDGDLSEPAWGPWVLF
jgi:TolB protein